MIENDKTINILEKTSKTKSKQAEKSHSSKLATTPPYSLLVHPNKNKNPSDIIQNQPNIEDFDYSSEHILEMPDDTSEKTSRPEHKVPKAPDKQSEKLKSMTKPILPNNHSPENIKSKQPEKAESPYSLLVHPVKNINRSTIKRHQKLPEESETASEHILEAPSDYQPEKKFFTKNINYQNKRTIKSAQSNQTEKVEPPTKPPHSHPNTTQNQSTKKNDLKSAEESIYVLKMQEEDAIENSKDHSKSTQKLDNSKDHTKSTQKLDNSKEQSLKTTINKPILNRQEKVTKNDQNETEFTSDCILEELDEKAEEWNNSENTEFASSSEMFFNSSQSNIGLKSIKQGGNSKSTQTLIQTPDSLFARQSQIIHQEQTNIDLRSEISTDDDQSEKAIVTEKFLLANIKLQGNLDSDTTEKVEQTMHSIFENKNQSSIKSSQKVAEEYEIESNKVQKVTLMNQSEKNSPQENIKSKQSEKVEPPKTMHSIFENKNQSNIKNTQKTKDETEYILKIPDEKQSDKTKIKDKSNELTKSNQTEKLERQKSPSSLLLHPNQNKDQPNMKNNQFVTEESEIELIKIPNATLNDELEKFILLNNRSPESTKSPYSLLVHPNRNIKRDHKLPEESETASEHVLEAPPDDQPDKTIYTKNFKYQNKRTIKNAKSKQTEKVEQPPKASQISTIDQKTNIKQTECFCEYVLEMPEEKQEENLKNDEKSNECTKSKLEPSKLSVTKPHSLFSLNPDKNIQQSFINNIQTNKIEPEIVTEQKLDDNQIDQPQRNIKSKQTEKVDSPIKKPNSPLVNPNKSRQQTIIKNDHINIEKSENACEYILKIPDEQPEDSKATEKFILQIDQPRRNIKSKQTEKVDSPIKKPNSPLVNPNKSRQQTIIKNDQINPEKSCEHILELPNEQPEKYILHIDKPQENIKSKQSTKSISAEKYILPNNQPQESMKSKQPEKYILLNDKPQEKTKLKQPTKTTLAEKYILPNNQPQENMKSKQPMKVTVDEKYIHPNKQTEKEEPNKKPYSLLVHSNKRRSQSCMKYSPKFTEESEYASEYILEIPEDQSPKPKPKPKSKQTHQIPPSKSRTDSVLQNKNKQQTPIKKSSKNTQELNCVSEYILEIPDEKPEQKTTSITKKSNNQNQNQNQLVSIKTTDQQNKKLIPEEKEIEEEPILKSLLTEGSSNQIQIIPEPGFASEYKLAELQEQIERWSRSEYLEFASSSEKIFNSSRSSVNAKQNQQEKEDQSKSITCSLLEIDKSLQDKTKNEEINNTTDESQSEKAIVTQKFLLCNLQTQQNKDEIIEPLIPSKISYSILLRTNKNDHKSIEIKHQKHNEDENGLEFLDDHDSETITSKKDTEKRPIKINAQKNQTIDTQNEQISNAQKNSTINTQKNSIINTQKSQVNSGQKKKAQQQKKKKPFVSTYDPSVFYNDSVDITRCTFEFQNCPHHTKKVETTIPEQLPLTVSLKDIGLEGLDSNNIEKISELKRLQLEEKNKSRILIHVDDFGERTREQMEPNSKTEVVCKLSPYERKDKLISTMNKVEQIDPYFALFPLSDEQNNCKSNHKPASLLDSTQKTQKIQAIKPKKSTKNSQKTKTGPFNSSYDETQLNSLVCRSPRRYKSPNNESDENKDSLLY